MEIVKKQLYDSLEKAGKYALYSYDIIDTINKPIFQFDDLNKLNNIHELLPRQRDAVTLFVKNNKSNIGHWCALIRYGNTIEFFDSYGENLYKHFEYQRIMKNYNFISNKYRFQEPKFGINTCGYHCIWRIYCALHKNMNLDQYIEFMKTPKEHDRVVVFYVSQLIERKNLNS